MKNLSENARKTILEMLHRYSVSVASKENYDELYGSDKRDLKFFIYGCIALSIFILSMFSLNNFEQSLLSFMGETMTFGTLMLSGIISLFMFLHMFGDDKWGAVFKVFGNIKLSVTRRFYILKRYLLIKKSTIFENNLKDNYEEIRTWFSNNRNKDELKNLIDEMKFPVYMLNETVSVKGIKKALNHKEVTLNNLNDNFVSFEDLDSCNKVKTEIEQSEKTIEFFAKGR